MNFAIIFVYVFTEDKMMRGKRVFLFISVLVVGQVLLAVGLLCVAVLVSNHFAK